MTRPAPEQPPAPLYLRAPDAKLPAGARADDPASVSIRRWTMSPLLAALHAASFRRRLERPPLSAICSPRPGVFAFVRPDGFVLARAAGGEAEILTLAVGPPARRQGLGRALIAGGGCTCARIWVPARMFLEVGDGQSGGAARFMPGLGFRPGGPAQGPIMAGKDALVLKAACCPLPFRPGDFA